MEIQEYVGPLSWRWTARESSASPPPMTATPVHVRAQIAVNSAANLLLGMVLGQKKRGYGGIRNPLISLVGSTGLEPVAPAL